MALKQMLSIQKSTAYKKFLFEFEIGRFLYFEGEWREAKGHLSQALNFKPDDTATEALIEYMK
jgi:uncharacterized protein HemY